MSTYISLCVWSRRKATKSASPVRNSDVNNEGRDVGAGDGREGGIARFGVYSKMHKDRDPFSHSRGGKVGSHSAEHNASSRGPLLRAGPNPIRACTKKSKRPNRIYISFVNES